MIGETRSYPGGGPMTVEEIEHELGQLRMDEEGSVGLRASVLNLIVVTDEESAPQVTEEVSRLAGRYPARAILLISDPEPGEPRLDVRLSAFCNVRGGTPGAQSTQVCAEQITVHAEGPPAEHLESIAGPLLIPDLPVFLWYPRGFSPLSPEFAGMAELADRLIIDSGASGDNEGCIRELAGMVRRREVPAVGDLQWVGLSPWRSLLADVFSPPERTGLLREIERVEVLHAPDGECRALLLVGWLADTLGWRPESVESNGGREVRFSSPAGDVTVEITRSSPEATLRRVRLRAGGLSFQVSRHREAADARTTVM
nr:glucose-6-phosphate dehydrogenase assembly protein OpcA [Rubrobacter sp.]